MTHNGKQDGASNDTMDPIAVWERLLDDVAEQAAEDYIPTEDDRRWAAGVDAMVMDKLAALDREAEARTPRAAPAAPIPASLLALDRASLLARIESLRQSGSVRYAHQDLIGLTDSDLRTLLAGLLATTEE